mmetsp:Transcript_22145/g.64291  ORF Transcript_22145/g.64291 Transcript_22145/m.64291 type:complete len:391 (-) Transcript_22145:30-1202(-)
MGKQSGPRQSRRSRLFFEFSQLAFIPLDKSLSEWHELLPQISHDAGGRVASAGVRRVNPEAIVAQGFCPGRLQRLMSILSGGNAAKTLQQCSLRQTRTGSLAIPVPLCKLQANLYLSPGPCRRHAQEHPVPGQTAVHSRELHEGLPGLGAALRRKCLHTKETSLGDHCNISSPQNQALEPRSASFRWQVRRVGDSPGLLVKSLQQDVSAGGGQALEPQQAQRPGEAKDRRVQSATPRQEEGREHAGAPGGREVEVRPQRGSSCGCDILQRAQGPCGGQVQPEAAELQHYFRSHAANIHVHRHDVLASSSLELLYAVLHLPEGHRRALWSGSRTCSVCPLWHGLPGEDHPLVEDAARPPEYGLRRADLGVQVVGQTAQDQRMPCLSLPKGF